ncbi:hypothetical protein, partial [Massilia eurypsychrophila]|uniref:hypothetical protein n=1 Tax=Massilia eurypsychrophila TaxID=1485217 RepID=UPI001C556CBE
RNLFILMLRLFEKRGDFRQYFGHDGFRKGIDLADAARGQVNYGENTGFGKNRALRQRVLQ